jgi:tRNA-uridine 2-sulfurtransferase
MKKRVAVGLSGGVDSATTAKLLLDQGYEVVGVHLYCWPPLSEIERDGVTREEWIKKNGCRADDDRQDALKSALKLGIDFKVLDFSQEYKKRVVDYFYREYEAGRTPNPDILCNSEIKFGLFLEWAIENGFDYVATGHYAQVKETQKGYGLFQPKDLHKDQTYFLYRLGQEQLKHVLFPLGNLLKSEVRELAAKFDLPVATKKDSQGICFVGDVEIREFISRRLKKNIGEVVDTTGKVIGEHDGVWFYTIGQRGGWRLMPDAQKKYAPHGETPQFYVISKSAKENKLVVGFGADAYEDSFDVSDLHFVHDPKLAMGRLVVRIRNTGELMPCDFDGKRVILDKAVRGIAPGQSAVFYTEGECLGGGVIA